MRKPELRILQAISSLQSNPEFGIFFKWLESSFFELNDILIKDMVSTDIKHRVIQGMTASCGQIVEIIKTVDEKIRAITTANKEK